MARKPRQGYTDEGKRIVELMSAKNVSRQQMAEALGVTPAQISRLLTGERDWTKRNWDVAARTLGVTPQELYGEQPVKLPDSVVIRLVIKKGQYRRIADAARDHNVEPEELIKFATGDWLRKKGIELDIGEE